MLDREQSDQRAESVKRSREMIQSLDLLLSNSILRIQSYEEYIGTRPADYYRDMAFLGQSLRYTVFQRFSIFQIVGQRTASPPKLRLVSRINTPNSKVPENKSKTMTSEPVIRGIEEIIKNKEYSRAVLHEREGVPLITYVLQSRSRENVYFVFTAPLLSLFEKIDLRSSESLEIEDTKSRDSWIITSDGNNKSIRVGNINKHIGRDDSLLQTLRLGEPQQTTLKVHFHFNFQKAEGLSASTITGIMSILITLIISYLFWVLVQQNRRVSRLVIEKTHDLEQAHQELQEALVTKSRFLGNISHEIRTPLNLILGMVDLCEEKDTDKRIHDYLSSMRSSGNHLLSMIEDLLDLAKADTNELQVQPKRMHLINFLTDISKISGRDCAKKDLRFYSQFAFDLPAVINFDPSRLRQILLNLLRNACKYTSDGHVTLRVTKLQQQQSHIATLRFDIEDTGIGIQDDKLNKVFDAFFQVENSSAFSEGGVGLGLAIVKELVNKLNGRLHVESTPKKGTLFRVDLDVEVIESTNWVETFRSPDDQVKEFTLISDDKNLQMSADALSMHPAIIYSKLSYVAEIRNSKSSHSPQNNWILLDASSGIGSAADIDLLHKHGNVILLGKKDDIITKSPGLTDPVLDSSPLSLADVFATTGFYTKSARRAEARETAQPKVEIAAPVIPDGLNILVADDDMGNQELYMAYFDGQPWNVKYTQNGKEALDAYTAKQSEVVVLDVRMPLMDGFEAAEKMRAFEVKNNLPQRPILLVTADALEETKLRAQLIPNTSFLTKPIRKKTLMDAITSVLK
ncbi:ATP-binding protein [Bdellovibrio sp. SKB1291214]|uniref:hybrid sensor histidine kinase/response regulator n=1 Tax=Bdellovibrio sp. SKB1291214 TaxID=1732569 RepID=UPI001C3C9084|nr:ATP-binding protein [Bdellovibrio sp. SKB1291214]UYL10030.1 ATP-binding protein [Bdellovibrio sp. SKB1291214]